MNGYIALDTTQDVVMSSAKQYRRKQPTVVQHLMLLYLTICMAHSTCYQYSSGHYQYHHNSTLYHSPVLYNITVPHHLPDPYNITYRSPVLHRITVPYHSPPVDNGTIEGEYLEDIQNVMSAQETAWIDTTSCKGLDDI